MFRVADRGNNPTPCQTGVQGIPILHRSRPARGLSGRAGRNRSAGRNLDIAGLSRWGRLRASREGVSLIRFDCPDELKFAVVNEAIAVLRARHRTVDVDGVRVLFPHGWGLVRASNTQPVLVMRFEATTPELLQQYRREVEAVVEAAKHRALAANPGRGL
jgi:hypothetical protein